MDAATLAKHVLEALRNPLTPKDAPRAFGLAAGLLAAALLKHSQSIKTDPGAPKGKDRF